jgi:hypothetical protein
MASYDIVGQSVDWSGGDSPALVENAVFARHAAGERQLLLHQQDGESRSPPSRFSIVFRTGNKSRRDRESNGNRFFGHLKTGQGMERIVAWLQDQRARGSARWRQLACGW